MNDTPTGRSLRVRIQIQPRHYSMETNDGTTVQGGIGSEAERLFMDWLRVQPLDPPSPIGDLRLCLIDPATKEQ